MVSNSSMHYFRAVVVAMVVVVAKKKLVTGLNERYLSVLPGKIAKLINIAITTEIVI